MSHDFYAVVMAGGRGTRLWPISRRSRPKQFLELAGEGRSLLQAAVRRAGRTVEDAGRVLVVAPLEQAGLVREQLPDLPDENLVLEPVGRNTAAAIGLAAIELRRRNPKAVMGVYPADHLFRDERPWIEAVRTALEYGRRFDGLVTIGMQPTSPSPSYGYLYLGEALKPERKYPVFRVNQFVEKPSSTLAQTYLDSGNYLWNTGTFAWKVTAILRGFETHLPYHYAGFQKIEASPDSWEVIASVYPALDDISIDYGVLERASNVAVVKADFERIDLGNLSNLAGLSQMSGWSDDRAGNAWFGDGMVVDGQNNLVYNDSGAGITIAFGLDDTILIRQDDVVLALPKREAHRIKDLLANLRESGLERYL